MKGKAGERGLRSGLEARRAEGGRLQTFVLGQPGLDSHRATAEAVMQEFIRAADERLDDYLRRLDEGDISRKTERAAARARKTWPRRSRLSAKNAAATGRFWRSSSGPARARYR